MQPAKLMILAARIFLSLGLTYGYGNLVREMASAAVHAQTHKPFSAAKFNRMLWSNQRLIIKSKGERK